jgi:hypothetical protein
MEKILSNKNIDFYWGITQGDPIYPYLCIICVEALGALLTKANEDGALTGVRTSKRGPRISHLFLRMIASFFVSQIVLKGRILQMFYSIMKLCRANISMLVRLQSYLARILPWRIRVKFWRFRVSHRLNDLTLIWDSQL